MCVCVCVCNAQGSIFYEITYSANNKKKIIILDLVLVYLCLSLRLVPQIEYNIPGSAVKSLDNEI